MIQTKLRIPTKHTYAFVEMDLEVEKQSDVKQAYNELYELMNAPETPEIDFTEELLGIVQNNLNITDIPRYEEYTPKQKELLKEIKNLVARAISKYKPVK